MEKNLYLNYKMWKNNKAKLNVTKVYQGVSNAGERQSQGERNERVAEQLSSQHLSRGVLRIRLH